MERSRTGRPAYALSPVDAGSTVCSAERVTGVPPLVGRRAELQLVTDAMASPSVPRTVVLAGEAGVGKTRLLGAAVDRARAGGTTVLLGHCLPLTGTVPFLPITEALRELGPEVAGRASPAWRTDLARLVPEWADGPAPETSGPIEGWQRGRLFAALRHLLGSAGCALVVEDVHWADETTLDFLVYASGTAAPIVLTCREEEAGAGRPVGRRLGELTRRPGVTRVTLARLSYAEVTEQITGLLGTTTPRALVDEVFRRAGGNAFFTEQLVAAAVRHEPGLPDDLVQLVLARAGTVSDDGREVLASLAVAGRGLTDTALAAVTGLEPARLGGAVRELVGARLIDRPGADGEYRLRHAVVGEVVTADLLAGERRERHGAVARCLPADVAGEIAEHWAAAGRPGDEMPWRVTAAGRAEQVYAHREAARHWQRVIDLWPQADRPPGVDLAEAYLRALTALDRCGDSRAASPLAERAVRVLTDADPRRLALIHDRVSTYRWIDGRTDTFEPLETAKKLLRDLPPSRELALVLHSYATRITDTNQPPVAQPQFLQALAVADAAGPSAADIKVKIVADLAGCALHAGDVAGGERWMARAGELAALLGDPVVTVRVMLSRADHLWVLNRLEEAAAVCRAALGVAERAGLDEDSNTEFLRARLFEVLSDLGRPAEAEPALPAWAEPTRTGAAAIDRAYFDLLAGNVDAADERLAASLAVVAEENRLYGSYLVPVTEIDLWRKRPGEALARIRQADLDPSFQWGWTGLLLRTAARVCADAAEIARAARDDAALADVRRYAAELVDTHAALDPDPFAEHPYWSWAPADGALWRAELTRVAGASDPDAWAQAAAAWETLGRPHRSAYARWRQAEALLRSTGRTARVRDCLRAAAAAADQHAPLLAEIRALARLARLDLRAGPAAAAPPPVPYGLTSRELEVLRLVADGLSNAEIGTRLFIGKKTASVHVTNILRKLDVANRTQAATVAHRAGLLAGGPERTRGAGLRP
ncbi:helix-turn-helix transcriptional regulator [Actinoplanes sp. URMC 104]|uniref:helix-turn-helix transcriptional regulator n=1 Tax=Actinoplanes sp. URMC 104 TaxID=3423409 RepID=UPI003F1DB848